MFYVSFLLYDFLYAVYNGVRLNMELLDIVDENGIPTGKTIERKIAHSEGIRHRTAHVWIIRKTDNGAEVLLQKRAMGKDSFPGRYDTSSAGHIQAGDEPEESAIREMKEELGIDASVSDLHFVDKFVINYKKEKWWIWNKTIKKFGKKAQYEVKRKIIEKKGKQEESVIVVVRNEETYDIVGIIPIIRNIEEMKNETYQL